MRGILTDYYVGYKCIRSGGTANIMTDKKLFICGYALVDDIVGIFIIFIRNNRLILK